MSEPMRLVHYSAAPIVEMADSDYEQAEHDMKPEGFWVSVDSCEQNWRDWCLGDGFSLDRLRVPHDVELAPDANVLILSTPEALDAFDRRFAVPLFGSGAWRSGMSNVHVRWREVAAKYDGLIIAPYQWSRRYEIGWYYTWDCASGVLWRRRAIASVRAREAAEPAGE